MDNISSLIFLIHGLSALIYDDYTFHIYLLSTKRKLPRDYVLQLKTCSVPFFCIFRAMSKITLVALWALLAVAASQTETESEFLAADLCSSWTPLGENFQNADGLPYMLECSPSSDERSIMSKF